MKRGTKPTTKQPDRKQIWAPLLPSLWREFRAICVRRGVTQGALLEELIQNFIDKDKEAHHE
jgi:hypothetical protein